MPRWNRLWVLVLLAFASSGDAVLGQERLLLVPLPREHGPLEVCTGTKLVCEHAAFRPQVDAFVVALARFGATEVELLDTEPAAADDVLVRFVYEVGFESEGYQMFPDRGLTVRATAPAGVARATATLLQSLNVLEGRVYCREMVVRDAPEFAFRCFMVDMGRNPHSPAMLRQVVDMMWLCKANYLQLHLTDDQLSSWPSAVFPELRDERAGWTLADYRELEAYSQARGVTVIPELDMPAHSTVLRRAYPNVFGKSPTELATSPVAQAGVERLIDEMLAVFRATPFFHIGGDEAYGVPVTVQRAFLNRLNVFVRSRGRRTIVWEGPAIGEGDSKVATDVLHMNWNTVSVTAQAMLDAGYEVVNAAWDPFYLVDHYPRTMFTAVALDRIYAWEPRRFGHVDPGFPTQSKPHVTASADGIVGFCMPWWEGREENLLPLCLPRLATAAAVAWNRSGETDYAAFRERLARFTAVAEVVGDFELPELPVAKAASQVDNLLFGCRVTASAGAEQPHFGPARLTNGITTRFDHFLGFPTKPEPLDIVAHRDSPATIARIVVHETAVGQSHEVYELAVSATADGPFEVVGTAKQGSRGEQPFVEHRFDARPVQRVRIRTQGCHGLTFPSFSRLTEIQAFAN